MREKSAVRPKFWVQVTVRMVFPCTKCKAWGRSRFELEIKTCASAVLSLNCVFDK